MKLKRQEFLALKQGGMTVSEYRDKFIQLSRYASADVATDGQKQDYFRLGLLAPIRYQLMVHRFESFQKLVDNAIAVENARKEMGEQKRKFESQSQSSNSRPHFGPPQGNQIRPGGGQNANFGQNQYQYPRQVQQNQQNQQSAQHFNPQQNCQNTPVGTPVRNNNTAPTGSTVCFKCGGHGHYANRCPNPPQNTPAQNNASGQRQTPQQ